MKCWFCRRTPEEVMKDLPPTFPHMEEEGAIRYLLVLGGDGKVPVCAVCELTITGILDIHIDENDVLEREITKSLKKGFVLKLL